MGKSKATSAAHQCGIQKQALNRYKQGGGDPADIIAVMFARCEHLFRESMRVMDATQGAAPNDRALLAQRRQARGQAAQYRRDLSNFVHLVYLCFGHPGELGAENRDVSDAIRQMEDRGATPEEIGHAVARLVELRARASRVDLPRVLPPDEDQDAGDD